jgi:hypothetical protein
MGRAVAGLVEPAAQLLEQVVPVTRWEARPGTVQIPVARTDWIEETRTTQVPVTTYRTVSEEHHSRVALGATPTTSTIAAGNGAATSVALRPIGGQQMQSDPPKDGNPWGSGSGNTYRR